jgi:hypothetical protein
LVIDACFKVSSHLAGMSNKSLSWGWWGRKIDVAWIFSEIWETYQLCIAYLHT